MERRLVYDSDAVQAGRCPTCGKRMDRCTCVQPRSTRRTRTEPKAANLPNDGVVRLLRDRKGRGGKTVTLITGLTGSPASLNALATDLKRMCGTGGTMRDAVLELQGDFRDRLQTELERRGYTVRVAGGPEFGRK